MEPYFLSPIIGERERQREGRRDREGERDTEIERGRDGGRGRGSERNFNSGRKLFYLPPARERGWRKGTREGRERGMPETGRERESVGGREILTAEEFFFLLLPHERERVAEGRAGGGEREGRRDRGGERERGRGEGEKFERQKKK